MMVPLLKNITEITQIVGSIFGIIIQYMHGEKKGKKALVVISSSTIFTGFFIIKPILDIYNVDIEGPLRILAYSLSSLLSAEIIALIMKIGPVFLKKKIMKFMEIENDNTK